MTKALSGNELAERLRAAVPGSVAGSDEAAVLVHAASIVDAARFLRDDYELDLGALIHLTAVDYVDYFEIVYRLTSYYRNHGALMKTRAYGREAPEVPSVIDVWKSADLQEREVYDLMGVRFSGHPDMKRIFLWEGFDGHPLRKDFLLRRP